MISLSDDLGRTVNLPGLPHRIVSLVPSITLTLFDLGAGEKVAGRTKFCIHPSPEIQTIPIIGGTKKIRINNILALQPDLVIANKEENDQQQIEELQEHVSVFITEVKDWKDNIRLVENLGKLSGKSKAANDMIHQMNAAWSKLLNKTNNNLIYNTLYVIWKNPYMSIGRDTFIHDIMKSVGLKNVFCDQYRYPEFNPVQLKLLSPELVLLSSEPYPFQEKHVKDFRKMLPEAKIILVDGEAFSWYGSKMTDTPAYLETLLTEIGDI